MKKEKNVETEKNIGAERNMDVEKSTKKDKGPYDARIDFLQEEFNLSNLEADGMKKFLESPTFNKKSASMKDVLNNIIETDKLNVRQKMALSYSIGMFQVEMKMIRMPIIPDMMHMRGLGG